LSVVSHVLFKIQITKHYLKHQNKLLLLLLLFIKILYLFWQIQIKIII